MNYSYLNNNNNNQFPNNNVVPPVVLFNYSTADYYNRLQKTQIENNNKQLQNNFYSSDNVNLINKLLQQNIKQKYNTTIQIQKNDVIYKFMKNIYTKNFNNLNSIDYELKRLNNLVLNELEEKTITNIRMKQKYLKDVNDISHIYNNFKYPTYISTAGSKLTNVVDRMIDLNN